MTGEKADAAWNRFKRKKCLWQCGVCGAAWGAWGGWCDVLVSSLSVGFLGEGPFSGSDCEFVEPQSSSVSPESAKPSLLKAKEA